MQRQMYCMWWLRPVGAQILHRAYNSWTQCFGQKYVLLIMSQATDLQYLINSSSGRWRGRITSRNARSVSDISHSTRYSSTSTENDTAPFLDSFNANCIATSSLKVKHRRTKGKVKNLRVLNINFQSLRRKGNLLKIVIDDVDRGIIIGTETLLDNSIASSKIFPSSLEYEIHRRDRPGDPHGGVLIAAKEFLHFGEVKTLLSAPVKVDKPKVHVAAYYRPPNKSDEPYLGKVTEEFSLFKSNAKKCVLLIGGDFNLPDINWRDLAISSTQCPSRLNKTFLDIVADNSLEQIVDFPTRKDITLHLTLTSLPRDVNPCHQ